MKRYSLLALMVLVWITNASAQEQYRWYMWFQGEEGYTKSLISDDIYQIQQALVNTTTNSGSGGATLRSETDRIQTELKAAATKVSNLRTYLQGVETNFTALRAALLRKGQATVTMVDPAELRQFCSNNKIGDLSDMSKKDVIAKAFEDEAVKLDAINQKLAPVAKELSEKEAGWKATDPSKPAEIDEDSPAATAYRASDRWAQESAHRARVAVATKIKSAADHAAWAAYRLREMKTKTLARFDSENTTKKNTRTSTEADGRDQQTRCADAVRFFEGLRGVAASSAAPGSGQTVTVVVSPPR